MIVFTRIPKNKYKLDPNIPANPVPIDQNFIVSLLYLVVNDKNTNSPK
jgi:hypothetical protein